MKGVARRRQTQTQNSSSTSPTMTNTGSDIVAPHETNTQALSDVFARLECELNELQTFIQTPKARAAALTTADQDIAAAKRLMLSTLTRRNMLAPISILPVEVLSRIFHFTVFSEQPDSLGWVHVTHVCRRWRQVTLDDSTLWTRFSRVPRNKDWITERLSRARNAPLVVELDGSMGEDTLSLFTPHISHTRELYLHNWTWFLLHSEIVQKINIQKAPALERLEISVSSSSMSIVERFFNGPLPKLRIFRVSQLHFSWSLVPRGRLTQLEVTQNVDPLITPVSPRDELDQLFDLLSDCPALEVLTLKNCLPAMLSKPLGGQTIHLPRLSRLSLGGSSSHVTNMLRMLKLSSSTRLRLNFTENNATHSDHDILPFLWAHFNDPSPVKFRSFNITLDSGLADCLIEMVASTSLPTSPIVHTHVIQADSDAELGLSFPHFARLGDRVDILRRACDVLSLSNVEFLSVYFPTRNQFINWSDIFRHCTKVTTVQVYGRGTIGLLQALTPPKRANTTAGGKGRKTNGGDGGGDAWAQVLDEDDNDSPGFVNMPIFPKLTSLLLEMLDFTDAVPASGNLYDLILETVQRRKATETPLTTLCIDRCVIGEKKAKELEKVITYFRWDHDEGDDDDDDDEEGEDGTNREYYNDEYDFNFDDFYSNDYGDDYGDYY